MTKFYVNLAEHVVASYLFTFVSLMLASGFDYLSVSALTAAAVSSIPAALSVIKGALALFVGDPESADLTK